MPMPPSDLLVGFQGLPGEIPAYCIKAGGIPVDVTITSKRQDKKLDKKRA